MGKVAYQDVVYKLGATSASLATVGLYDFSANGQAEIMDVSDSASGDNKEFLAGMLEKGIGFSKWFDDSETPYEEGDTVYLQVIAGNKTLGYDCIVESANLESSNGSAVKWTYSLKLTGATD